MSRYTKQHYEDFAKICAKVSQEHMRRNVIYDDFTTLFVLLFQQDNPRFDEGKFNEIIKTYRHEVAKDQ
jgi:hypothetical protein